MSKNIADLRARYNAGGNAVVPNSFQCSNFFVDVLMALLTPEENVVLLFAIRRIMGFTQNISSRKDRIAMSQFVDGITGEDGRLLSRGCGLSYNAVSNALDSLEKYRILLPTQPKTHSRAGTEYWLQGEENGIDLEGLQKRVDEKLEAGRVKTYKARMTSVRLRSGVTSVPQRSTPQSDKGVDLSPTEVQNPQKPTETHLSASAAAKSPKASDFPDLVLFREVASLWPQKGAWHPVLKAMQKIRERLGRDPVADDLTPFFEAWCAKGFKPLNIAWLEEWAVLGKIPQHNEKGNGHGQPQQAPRPATPADQAAARLIVARQREAQAPGV